MTKIIKKLILPIVICLLGSLFIGLFTISAQTPTKSATRSASPTPDKISELKERIATQVAKLNIIQKRGIAGITTGLSNNQIILQDLAGNKRLVDVDELTKFEDLGGKQIGISDLKKETGITVIGLYNTESRRILARFIRIRGFPQRIIGEVTDLDKKTFTLEVFDPERKDTSLVEVENTTKTNEWIKEEMVRSGFSKIVIGEKILVIGTGEKRLIARRILLLPELSPNIKATPTASPTPTPTLKPSPTKKPTPTVSKAL